MLGDYAVFWGVVTLVVYQSQCNFSFCRMKGSYTNSVCSIHANQNCIELLLSSLFLLHVQPLTHPTAEGKFVIVCSYYVIV